ncbi:MAG: hypothetical protein WA071_10555 [Undibacterium umbellatum]|uniref:hypothetical protein n=1 Tax=Undibacterium umbellatum TaxID=2762300 RepID=UPI003BB4EF49
MHTSLPPRVVADALWLMTARSRGGQHWLNNATCDVNAIEIAGQSQPVTFLDNSTWQESYVASPRSTWLRYPRQEILRDASAAKAQAIKLGSCAILGPLSALFKASKLDQAAIIANHLVSTNLYSDWTASEISKVTDKLLETYPQRPLMMRNICPQVNPELTESLLAKGWQLFPSRMIYLCDPQQASVWKHNHVKQDARLLDHPVVEVLGHETLQMHDIAVLQQLYRQLFIDKHSYLNPDFSAAFFELCLETEFLEMHALRWQGKLVGVLGIYTHPEQGWLTTPLIGYDTSLPKELGLYRRLMALLLKTAKDKKLKLHYSSGASQFKRARGGIPQLEYTAIYNRHLSTTAVQSAAIFGRLLTTFAPSILKKADGI